MNDPAITLNDLRRLLEGALKHDDNPAVLRLPESERTVEGVVRAYLPQSLRARDGARSLHYYTSHMLLRWSGTECVDLDDPGTAHAVLVALALYLGLDPGEGALGCAFVLERGKWELHGSIGWCMFLAEEPVRSRSRDTDRRIEVLAPEVAAETNARKALALAVRRVLS